MHIRGAKGGQSAFINRNRSIFCTDYRTSLRLPKALVNHLTVGGIAVVALHEARRLVISQGSLE